MEIIKSSKIYKFKPPLPKVHFIQPAFNNSIVLIYQVELGRDGLKHISQEGKQLYCHFFQGLVDTLAMPSQTQAVVLLVASNQIFTINLSTRTPTIYNHYYKIQDSCQVKFQTFYNTRLVCIRENGAYNNHILKLTYYRYPFQCNSQKICQRQCQFEGVEGEWTYQYTIRKGNDRSMILWYKSRHDEQFEIRMFEIENQKGNYRVIRIRNSLGDAYGVEHINCSVQQIWETRPNEFCIVATTEKNEKKCVNARGNVVNNFIWQVDKEIIRQAPFQLDPKYNNFLIDCHPFGKYSMFRSFYIQNGTKFVPSPAIYIDNSTEKIVANEMWECNHFSRWIFPAFSDSLVVQAKFDNPVYEITLIQRLLPSRKMLSQHLMEQSEMQDLDYDLKNEIVELLDYD